VVSEGLYQFRGVGIASRVAAVGVAFDNAAKAQANDFSPETLFYPERVSGFSAARLAALAAAGLGLGAMGLWAFSPATLERVTRFLGGLWR
jgi:hypothetical protein